MGWKSCKPMTITLKGEPKKVIEEIKKAAAKSGTVFTGDEKSGKMVHKAKSVRGVYKITGKKITIAMQEDNFWVDCEYVNKLVKEWFKGK